MITVILLTILVVYISIQLWRRYQYFNLREKIGLTGPDASFLFGNMGVFVKMAKEKGYDDGYKLFADWSRIYGDTFGIYMGKKLEIVSIDEEFIKEAFIKQFSKFTDRCVPGIFELNGLNQSLVQMSKEAGWKDVRSCMSPQFSTGKMRMMYETVKDKIGIFLDVVEEHSSGGRTFDIYDDFQALTLDVIGKCAFAIECNCLRNPNEIFYIQAKEMFRQIDLKESLLVPLSVFLPELDFFWKKLYPMSGMHAAEAPFLDGLGKVYDMRKDGLYNDSVDVLQLLLNKSDTAGESLTRRQVIENCFAFLLAGYETTSTALGYCSYLLAKNPEIQDKLYEEIESTKKTQGLTFESIHAMEYLDAVFKETLRMYPPVINFTARQCIEDTTVCGQFVPKDTWVFVPPYTMHHTEKYWPNHDQFEPDRFLDWNEKNSVRFVPFGVGPRFCVGMRFAEMEFKMTMARLLDKFRIDIPDGTPEMTPIVMGIILQPKDGIKVRATPRN